MLARSDVPLDSQPSDRHHLRRGDPLERSEELMLSVSEQVSQEIHQGLRDRDFTALSSENAASLTGQLQNIVKKDNCIRSIIVFTSSQHFSCPSPIVKSQRLILSLHHIWDVS
ncbi:T-complex protein 11 X-linked protein 2 [Manis javanica]|nr:T-complex protein 11 X-linked protein 2 [Manis javanica]